MPSPGGGTTVPRTDARDAQKRLLGACADLFLLLTGLADGLAPKERRYAANAIRPNNLVPPLPPPDLLRAARDFSFRAPILTISTDG